MDFVRQRTVEASDTALDAGLRTERLLRITTAIADAITPEQVHEAVVDQVAAALQASSAALWVIREDGRSTQLVRSAGYPEAARERFDGVALDATNESFPALDAMRKAEPIWIETQAQLLESYPQLASAVSPGRRYRISCLPLVVHGRTLGALGFTFDDAPAFELDQRPFLQLVARYAGQALERLRLLEANQQARVRAELLYRLAASVIGAERIEQVFEAALEAIAKALGTQRSSILAYDPDGVMRFKAWRGLSEQYRRAVEGHSPWPRDARAPAPVLVPNVTADAAMTAYLPLFRQERIGGLAFIPLVAAGRLVGKFMVYYEGPRALGALELELARAIANHVAAALNRFASVAELQQTVRFSEMFTGILGHDLRNPLSAIMTSAQLALQRDESARLTRPLSRIVASGGRMARMIDQLLDFTRVRVGGGFALQSRHFDLVPVLRQVIDELDVANPACRLDYAFAGTAEGTWDIDRLQQVFSNLVANAVHHGIAEHGVQIRVDGTAAELVRVDVHNMGAIPETLISSIFEPMIGGERRHGAQGLGLGLYVTREILKAHGARIEVRSNERDGTTFSVSLPKTPHAPTGSGAG